MPEMIQTTVAAPVESLRHTVLSGSRRSAFNRRAILLWDSLVLSCLYSWGNQTSGSPLENPIQIAFRGEGAPGCFALSIEKLMEVNERYFGQLGEVEPEQVLSTEAVHIPEEMRALVEWLRAIPAVEALRAREIEQGFKTWVVVNNATEQTRYAIYRAEWDLMRRFPGVVFDFHLVDREGEDLNSIISFDEGTLFIPIGGALHAF